MTDFKFKILTMLNIKLMAKFDSIIHQVEYKDKFGDQKEARSKGTI